MLLHRFSTLEHIIASIEFFFNRKHSRHVTTNDLAVESAVEIARELQAIRGLDEAEDELVVCKRELTVF